MARGSNYHHGNLRAALIEAASEVVRQDGAEALKLRSLASQLGVTHAALYAHFRDKNRLLAAVLEAAYRRLFERLEALPKTGDAATRLSAIGQAYVRFALEERGIFHALGGPRLNRKDEYPDLETALNKVWTLMVQTVASQSGGSLPLGSGTAAAFWAAMHGLASQAELGRLRIAPDQIDGFSQAYAKAVCFGLGLTGDNPAA